jgi:DNA-binding NarL/FixJ family response regulator
MPVEEGTTSARIRVLIVDDHDLFRAGLASVLSSKPDIEVVAQAAGGRQGIRLGRELRPDVALIDLRMPDLDGPAAMRAILESSPSTRVLALTVASDDSDVAGAIVAGASGYLLKDSPIDDVVGAVRAAARGVAWLAPRAAEALFERIRRDYTGDGPGPELEQDLSPREVEVLRLVARGLDNSEIAAELSISPRTAKNHVSSILSKLEVPNRIQAATYAVRTGLA